ncbi:hypothetical protein [Georgenia satyanarayanai]|uniref:hypothetical protein n=1 Tax=Georgenia satyanarayanai TaxID=860221 RepID=UPI000DA14914|nr:hypothetical protein [Georgenia satyanarayanai]
MTQRQSSQTRHVHGEPRRHRWVLALVGYWVLGSIAGAVLPWTLPLLPALLTPSTGQFGIDETALLAGSIALGWIISVPIATAVGIALGLASAMSARVTKLWALRHRRGRWARYLGGLIAAYAVVVAAVYVLAPTATQAVTFYAVWAALLAGGSCLLLARIERRRDRQAAPL